MVVGVLRMRFRLPENGSLKDKRRSVKSICARVGNKFNISVAEIEDLDERQLATLGFACVSNDGRHANEVLSRVVSFIEAIKGDAEIIDYEMEILNPF